MNTTSLMFSPTLLLLVLLSLLAPFAEAGKGSGESGECQKRRDTCGHLCEEPPPPPTTVAPPTTSRPATVPTPPPGECVCTPSTEQPGDGNGNGGNGGNGGGGEFHSHCQLIEAFWNISIHLSISEQIEWEAWIVEIENSILVNSSLTNDQKVVLISLSLKAFFSLHVEIYNKLSFVKIADWGLVIDFLYVEVNIQLEITQSIVTLDGNGECELTHALKNASANGSPQEQQACNSLIVEILAILGDVSFTYEQQLGAIWNLCQAFFVQNPGMESWLLSIEISGYGSLQSFLDVCQAYERIVTIGTVISGSSTSDCVLLEALQQATQNASFDLSVQVQINQLLGKLQAYFQTTVDISLRLEYISQTCYQMFLLEPWMVSVIKQVRCGIWGDIYDIIFCSNICSNYGCGNPNDGPGPKGTTAGSSSSVAASSAAPPASSEAPASSPAPTVKPADCTTVATLITVDVTTNTTVLTNTLLYNYNNKFTPSQRLGFNSCFNKLRNAIWNDAAFPTPSSKLTECQKDLWSYNNNSVTQQQLVFNITIDIWVGTIGQFVSCIH